MNHNKLTPDELRRYRRHLSLPDIGVDGQARLKTARVLLVGAGGLGSPAAIYLAAAGVGTLGLVDPDTVDESNLQRQILHGADDVGRAKLDSAAATLHAINPLVAVEPHAAALTAANAADIIPDYDLIIDGTDNFATRYLINDACVLLGKPNCYGSVLRFQGQAAVFAHPDGPCYRCLYPTPPPADDIPDCAAAGVLGVLPGVIGMIQATEAIKLLLDLGQPLVGRVLLYDALALQFRQLKLKRDPECPVCGTHPTITEIRDVALPCPADQGPPEIQPDELQDLLAAGKDLLLLDVREPHEHQLEAIPGDRLIPLGDVETRYDELPADKRIVVYCRVGARSARAVAILRRHGFTDVLNLAGGILRWKAAGGAVQAEN